MKIENHLLTEDDGTPFPFQASPNHYPEEMEEPKYIIIHYTAGSTAESAIAWLCNPVADASAHLVIARDGTITQLVPFDKPAWHAGRSSYKELKDLNRCTIGIELDNAGKLTRRGDNWYSWFNKMYPADEVIEARHRYRNIEAGWHNYTEEQIDACREVCFTLKPAYKTLENILGHDDISDYGKVDPGPAFPMDKFQSLWIGEQVKEKIEKELKLFRRLLAKLFGPRRHATGI